MAHVGFSTFWKESMKHKKRTFLFAASYIWGSTTVHLATHPYRILQKIVFHDRILLPVVMSPLLSLFLLFIAGRIASFVFEFGSFSKLILAFILGVLLIALLLWQLLIFILVFRFWRARE